jgi:mono/diheme cytochrome c family protein
MRLVKFGVLMVAAAVALTAFLSAGQPAGGADTPAPTFDKDVKPFLQTYCVSCHGAVKPKGGINLESYDKVVNGGKALVKVGKPDDSRLCQVCEGRGKPMPPRMSKQPTAEEVKLLRAWVADGAKNY